ncbi:MAG TPA: hypothetical protein PKA06_04840 [Gemmatales bacterium]|nr:hypothetical protein [Gemmatales bacterium]
MNQIEPFESRSNMLEDMGLFEAAMQSAPLELQKVTVQKVLAIPDGSNQDATTLQLATEFSRLLDAQMVETKGISSLEGILQAISKEKADGLVVPVPFGSDIDELKSESLGDIFDRLLTKVSIPVLAVRQPLSAEKIGRVLSHIVVAMNAADPRNATTISWACRLLRRGGELIALEWVNGTRSKSPSMLAGDAPDTWDEASAAAQRDITRRLGSLVAALQKASSQTGFHTSVRTARLRMIDSILEAMEEDAWLAILARSPDRLSESFHLAADLVRSARSPVLLV